MKLTVHKIHLCLIHPNEAFISPSHSAVLSHFNRKKGPDKDER